MTFKNNRITQLFVIQYPIIAGGMVWCSSWRLASAVSNAGGLGLLGAGSMHPDTLRELLGTAAAKRGIFEGDLDTGELEIGQVVAGITTIQPVADIIRDLLSDFQSARTRLASL